MSIPTSIVVVHDRTSMAGCSLICLDAAAHVDVLEQQFVLLGAREDFVRLGGIQLCGVLRGDDAHGRHVGLQRPHRAGAVVALARLEDVVRIRVEDRTLSVRQLTHRAAPGNGRWVYRQCSQ